MEDTSVGYCLSTQTFLGYAAEVQLVFGKWLTAAEINNNFQLLKDFLNADKILSSVPGKRASFMKRADTLKDIHDTGTPYYDANRNILPIYSNIDVSIGTASKTENISPEQF